MSYGEEEEDVCALPLARRVAAMLDIDPATLRTGDAIPRGWHFILFTPTTLSTDLPRDGLPVVGEALPGLTSPKAMLGGRTSIFDGDIPIGGAVMRRRSILSVTPKTGRSGVLVIVKRRSEIRVEGRAAPAVLEDEDMVYREADAPVAPAAAATAPVAEMADVAQAWTPAEIDLFRYSAAGNNAHRIHYDLPYAQAVEGYDRLVVNGGLTHLRLLQLYRETTGREAGVIAARNLKPLFVGDRVSLKGRRSDDRWSLWAETPAGERAATLEIR